MQDKVNLCANFNFPRLQVRWWHLHEMLGLAAGRYLTCIRSVLRTCHDATVLPKVPSILPAVMLGYGQWLTGDYSEWY